MLSDDSASLSLSGAWKPQRISDNTWSAHKTELIHVKCSINGRTCYLSLLASMDNCAVV